MTPSGSSPRTESSLGPAVPGPRAIFSGDMLDGVSSASEPDVPGGKTPDEAADRPSQELMESWLGDAELDFEFRPGEDSAIPLQATERVAAARRFRDVLGRFASGVTVVTSLSGQEPVGMTCQSFASVSLEPPLVLFCPARTSRAWPLIRRTGRFCVNVLAEDQAELSEAMASRGTDKFAGVRWSPTRATGSPLLEGVLGYVDCTIHAVHEAGDHFVVIGRVQGLGVFDDVKHGLTFYEGRYGSTA
jgi:3-hydroxy-9,10-secoandrosta-1,3,5(10)-triene-9,17-dione monooxygenase reductase component